MSESMNKPPPRSAPLMLVPLATPWSSSPESPSTASGSSKARTGTRALGMVLASILVIRAYTDVRGSAEEWQAALEEAGAFDRISEGIAIKTSSPRIIRVISDFTCDIDSTH